MINNETANAVIVSKQVIKMFSELIKEILLNPFGAVSCTYIISI